MHQLGAIAFGHAGRVIGPISGYDSDCACDSQIGQVAGTAYGGGTTAGTPLDLWRTEKDLS
jgi:hypothetical protein